jgi:hypothetical protein
MVSQVDFPVTFTKMAGGDASELLKIDGVDVSAALLGGGGRNYIISSTQAQQLSYRDAHWKFIPGIGHRRGKSAAVVDRNEQNDEVENLDAAHDRLFDLQVDPGERSNVIAEHPEIAAKLRTLLDAQKAKGVNQPLPK